MADSGAPSNMVPADALFRPSKRRRPYRRRGDDDDDDDAPGRLDTLREEATRDRPEVNPSRNEQDASEGEDHGSSTPLLTEIMRLRQQVRNRRKGVEFVQGLHDLSLASGASKAAEPEHGAETHDTPEEVAALINRFAPQTGQVADVNQHMMAYIDSELAKLRRGSSDAAASSPDGTATGEVTSRPARTGFPSRQPATLGKLHEIDLGPAVKLTNIAKTEAAKKRIAAGHEEEEDLVGRSTKPRVGKDGKPWRGRRARTSEDVQRDKLVEEVLRETRLEIYDEPEPELNADDAQAADDRIAEKFRRDFLDAIQSRHRHRRRARGGAHAASKGVKKDDRPRGPKLGGSRSARAAMREHQGKGKK